MAIFDRPSVLVVGFDCASGAGPDSALALGLAQEVRLNLGPQRLELGLVGQHLQLQHPTPLLRGLLLRGMGNRLFEEVVDAGQVSDWIASPTLKP